MNIKEGICTGIGVIGSIIASAFGDYIIRGVDGEFYPCKPSVFEKTYELVEELF